MAKGKAGKSEGKKAKAAEKKLKQEKKGEKTEKKLQSKKNADDSDNEDVDLDAVLAAYAKQQSELLEGWSLISSRMNIVDAIYTVTISPSEPPKARASCTILGSPANSNELFMFGGEYFNGALAQFYNDLFIYVIDKDEWRLVTSPNTPLPRSGHAWCRGANSGAVYMFGGEFSSPKQGTFYHYGDFWKLDPSSREWEKLESKGRNKAPPARSGHRMTYYKQYIILFGGFQDTSQQTKYLSDLWLYDTQNFVWHNPTLPTASMKPDARSSFSFLPHEQGAVLYGGYSRVKSTVLGKATKGGAQSSRNVLKPLVHQDCWFLRITPPAPETPAGTAPAVRWERRKKPANAPTPARAGATMAYHKGRGIAFGGVHDVEESEEGIDSEFFNKLFAWNIERNRYFPLALRKARVAKKSSAPERGGRRGRGQANEEELLRNLAALQAGTSLADADDMEIDKPTEEEEAEDKVVKPVAMEFPHPRFNAQLAVQDDVLYIYGGTFEKGDREFTFDEMYSIDLGKLDGVKEIFRRELDNWQGSEDGDSEEEDDDDDEEDSEEEEEDEDGDVRMADEKKFTESKRKGRKGVEDTASTSSEPMPESSTFDDVGSEETSTTIDDSLPHPRAFESRRDFFVRTSNEWQELLMQSLRWKGIQPETLSVKEIKTKAFELSEEKWWDCREEITALEDEQEAAGIGEVVQLGDRGEAGAGGKRR